MNGAQAWALNQWLQEATGPFPPGVRARLAQEYRAHLEESEAGGGPGDPVQLFGSPLAVQRQLRRSYLSQATYDFWRGPGVLAGWSSVIGAAGSATHLPGLGWAALVIVAMLALWWLTRKIAPLGRSMLRFIFYTLIGTFGQLLSLLLGHPAPPFVWWTTLLACALLPAALVWAVPPFMVRLRRTLELQAGR